MTMLWLGLVVSSVFVTAYAVALEDDLVYLAQSVSRFDRECLKIPSEQNECGIAGYWKNELTSTMNITCEYGQLNGTYNSAVGMATKNYRLAGRYTLSGPNKTTCELGWAVAFNNEYGNSNSTTVWSGIYIADEGIIRTQWILTRYVETKDLWMSSLINHDEFRRIC